MDKNCVATVSLQFFLLISQVIKKIQKINDEVAFLFQTFKM